MAGPSDSLRLVSVVGAGRSGSTVLGSALEQAGSAFHMGEVSNLIKGWVRREPCSCGAAVPDCGFWREAVTRWLGPEPASDELAAIEAVRLRVEGRRAFPTLPRATPDQRRDYTATQLGLLRAVRDVAACPVLIDTSKSVSRAAALFAVTQIDSSAIHLLRDLRGVAWSLSKGLPRAPEAGVASALAPRPIVRTCLFWILTEMRVRRWGRRQPLLQVRYERFVQEPEATLRRIGSWIGLDLAQRGAAIARGEPVVSTHCVAGNRIRMKGPVALSLDDRWQKEMPGAIQLLLGLLARPWLSSAQ